jgi:hypothetical protein
MSNRTIPDFSSEELRKAVTEATPVIEGVDEARNQMSSDIKKLEVYLQGTSLKVPFRFTLGMSLVPYDDADEQQLAASLEYGGGASGWIEQQAIVWGEHQPTGKFRLMYELSRGDGCVEVDAPGGPYFWDENTLKRDLKPLIETKFEIRRAMYTHLADFVRALSSHCQIGKPTPVDDIPF